MQGFFDPRNEGDQADAAVANDVPNRIKPVAALEIRGCKPVFVDQPYGDRQTATQCNVEIAVMVRSAREDSGGHGGEVLASLIEQLGLFVLPAWPGAR